MKKRVLTILLALGIPVVALFLFLIIYINIPVTPREPQITLEKGITSREISQHLAENGIIRLPNFFLAYAKIFRHGESLKAGVYLFDTPVSPREVLEKITKGFVFALKVRLIEGWTDQQIADSLQALPSIKDPNFKTEFLNLTKDAAFIQSLGLNAKTLEGYLFPNTYYLEVTATPADYLATFVKLFQKNYQKALEGIPTLPALSQHQIVTLASIIEKESGNEAERQIIASVFYNRLAKGMPLQSDPTIIYGLKNFDGDIRKADITNPHLYNTYVHKGLPPGPICNPGLASIKAALTPAQTSYLYFVSKGDGTHYFSSTSTEHSEAVQKYQKDRHPDPIP